MAFGSNKQKLVIEGENKTKRAFGTVMRSMKDLGRQAAQMGRRLGIALGAASAALGVMVTKTIAAQDRIGKLSQQVGISTEALSEMQFAAEQTGASADTFAAGLEVMSKRLGEVATKGTGAAAPAIEALGLSVDDLVKMEPDQAFLAIADAMKGMSTQSERNAATANIFSRANQSLVNTLELGSAGMEEMRQRARDLGRSLSKDQTDAAAMAADAMNELKSALTGLANVITSKLAPTVTLAARLFTDTLIGAFNRTMTAEDEFQQNTVRMGDRVLQVMALITDVFRSSFSVISGAFQTIGKTLGAGGAQIVALFTGNFDRIKEIGKAWENDMADIFDSTIGSFDTTFARDQLEALQKELADETAYRKLTNAVDDLVSSNRDLFGSQQAVIESSEGVTDALGDSKTAIEQYAESSMAAKVEVQRAVSQMEHLFEKLKKGLPFSGQETQEQKENIESLWRTTDEIARDTIRGVRDAWVGFFQDTFQGKGLSSIKDFLGRVKDLFLSVIAEIAAAWTASKIFGGSFEIGNISLGGGGGNILTSGAAALGKKIFGGASSSSGAGQAVASGATVFPPASGGGATSASMIQASGATTTSGAGQAAGGSAAGLGAFGTAAAGAAIFAGQVMLIRAIAGQSSRDKALKDLQRAGPGVAGGLGLQAAAGDKFGFASGANAGFAAEFAKSQLGGNKAGTIGEGLAVFKGMNLEGTVRLLNEAQAEFERIKSTAAATFKLGQSGAARVGRALQDGFIDKLELVDLGFIEIGERIENTKSGVVKMGDLSVEQFDVIKEAIGSGALRLEALRGEVELSQREMDFLGRQGLIAGQMIGQGMSLAAQRARGDLRSIRDEGVGAFGAIESAANAAAGAAAGVGSGRSFGPGTGGGGNTDAMRDQLRRNADRRAIEGGR